MRLSHARSLSNSTHRGCRVRGSGGGRRRAARGLHRRTSAAFHRPAHSTRDADAGCGAHTRAALAALSIRFAGRVHSRCAPRRSPPAAPGTCRRPGDRHRRLVRLARTARGEARLPPRAAGSPWCAPSNGQLSEWTHDRHHSGRTHDRRGAGATTRHLAPGCAATCRRRAGCDGGVPRHLGRTLGDRCARRLALRRGDRDRLRGCSRRRWRCPAPAGRPACQVVRAGSPTPSGAGSHRLKLEPRPGVLSTVISPPIICARFRLIVRPSPVPPWARVYP